MKKERGSEKAAVIKGILLGLLLLILVCGIATALLTNVDWLYRIDMKALDIGSYSGGYSDEVILRNYHEAVGFMNRIFSKSTFTLPDLAVSEAGAVHFSDCRNITKVLYLLSAAAIPLIILLTLSVARAARKRYLITAGVSLLSIPALIAASIVVDSNWFFVTFHHIFFSNDYWLFDWDRDQVIRILPEPFFIHCAIVIVLFWFAAALILFLRAHRYKSLTMSGRD